MLGVAAWAQIPSLEEQFIFDLSKKKFDWLIRKDYDSLSFLLDDKIQYIHSNGWIQNKHEILDDLRTGKQYYFKSRNLSYRPLPRIEVIAMIPRHWYQWISSTLRPIRGYFFRYN